MKKQIAAVLTAVSVAATLAGWERIHRIRGIGRYSGPVRVLPTAGTSGDTVVIGETSMVDSIGPDQQRRSMVTDIRRYFRDS